MQRPETAPDPAAGLGRRDPQSLAASGRATQNPQLVATLGRAGIRYEPGNIRERISAYRVFNALPGRPG